MAVKKVMLVTNIPTPYRIPLFNELDKQLRALSCDFLVVFGGFGYSRRKWIPDMADCHFRHVVLRSRRLKFGSAEETMFFYSGLVQEVRREKPDVVIVIGYSMATMKLWLLSHAYSLRYIIWSGSIKANSRYNSTLRRMVRKVLIKRASGFIAYGTLAKEYLESLGAPRNKIEIGINTTDTIYYSNETENIRRAMSPSSGKKHLTYIGYLAPRKNVRKLLDVVLLLSQQRNDFVVDIIGDGEDRKNLESYVKLHKLDEFVKFHGFKQKKDIPFFLALSDCFLFQTDFDIWGLVLNEAMAAGVPCIASIHAGATHDLIQDGITGFAADFSESEKTAERIHWVLDHPEQASAIGRKAAQFIENQCTIKNSVLGFIRAIQSLT